MSDEILTARLRLRRPVADDAEPIFRTYSSDPDVTRYVGWPRHTSLDETRGFLMFSDTHWDRWHTGPYILQLRDTDALIGSTGLVVETADTASTGYVLARSAWGRGYATEALLAMVDLARRRRLRRLYAICHHEHRASAHVLEKGGFTLERRLERHLPFPNLQPGEPSDVLCFAMGFENLSGTEGEMRS